MAILSNSMKDVKGTVARLGENLEEKMAAGFRYEGKERKTDFDPLEANMLSGVENEAGKMVEGFKNEDNERSKVL